MKISLRDLNSYDFLNKLLDEDDWSFIIKSHALIEATVTNLITSVLGDDRVYELIERMPLSEAVTGKIAFAKQLDVLDRSQIKFIRWYSELRNKLVHKVENVSFDLKDYWSQLDKNQRKAWKDTLNWSRECEKESKPFNDLLEKYPKLALWISLLSLISVCSAQAEQAKAQKELNITAESTTKNYFNHQKELIKCQADLIEDLVSMLDKDA